MLTLSDLARKGRPRRVAAKQHRVHDGSADAVRARTLAMDAAAAVALPAGIDLENRAARMNAFIRALAEYQDHDVLVVALCSVD